MSWRRLIEEARPEEELLATGYSCRSQAKRFGKVRLRHPVEVLLEHLALIMRGNGPGEVRRAS
jgi:Fe-S oxidoreductase